MGHSRRWDPHLNPDRYPQPSTSPASTPVFGVVSDVSPIRDASDIRPLPRAGSRTQFPHMAPTSDPTAGPGVVGYLAAAAAGSHLDWGWHADPTCPELADTIRSAQLLRKDRTIATLSAPSGLQLAQAEPGRVPCPGCAYPAVLSDLVGFGEEGGYHVLVCNQWHWNPPSGCTLCAALSAYAGATYLSGRADDHIALLGAGALPTALAPLLERMHLATENSDWDTCWSPVSAPLWAAAAGLYHTGATLEAVLAAPGLYSGLRAG